MKLWRIRKSSAGLHDCVELRKRASDYLEANVSEGEKERIRSHLERCNNCRRFVETLRTTIELLRGLAEQAMPESLKDRLGHLPRNQGQGEGMGA